jgi:Lipase maturation factor
MSTSYTASRFALSRGLFLRLLGVVYLIAFGSLAFQIVGLVGADGLLPVGAYLDNAWEALGPRAWYVLPTLTWLGASDMLLRAICWGGVALAVAAIAGIAPRAVFPCLWAAYLSLVVAGQSFLEFQWDTLLLETGLVACLYAPGGWWPRIASSAEPSAAVRWLLWGLAFKLTFLSGITKLASGDPTWRDGTALTFHYMTQPLPAWTSWYVDHWPAWFHLASAGGVFFVELVVPFALLLPSRFRRMRVAACGMLSALQLGIAATGNYGFFNLLSTVLYLAALDDRTLRRLSWRRVPPSAPAPAAPDETVAPRAGRFALAALALVIGLLSLTALWREATYTRPHPVANALLAWVAPFRSINGYGLFRTMTTSRPEIVVEGSPDGETWIEYSFRWKPGDVGRRPVFIQPYMPRLDWQMWFAALAPGREQPWLGRLVYALLEASPDVLPLLGENPFPDAPPRYVRLVLYDYRFTSSEEGAESGDWWHRERLGELTGPVSLTAGP